LLLIYGSVSNFVFSVVYSMMYQSLWRSWLGTALQVGRSRVRFPIVSLEFFIVNNCCGRTMALGLTQPLTEMSTRNIPWGVKAAGAYG
jgi:hypothetical protein